jgi:hypothetical protein
VGVVWIISINSILLIGRRFVFLFILEDWGSGTCLLSIRLYWESGYGGLLWRERLFGVR